MRPNRSFLVVSASFGVALTIVGGAGAHAQLTTTDSAWTVEWEQTMQGQLPQYDAAAWWGDAVGVLFSTRAFDVARNQNGARALSTDLCGAWRVQSASSSNIDLLAGARVSPVDQSLEGDAREPSAPPSPIVGVRARSLVAPGVELTMRGEVKAQSREGRLDQQLLTAQSAWSVGIGARVELDNSWDLTLDAALLESGSEHGVFRLGLSRAF